MSKRFTDTEKWRHHWFKKLTIKQKLLWIYVLDSCSKAGIWPIDLEVAKVQLGFRITPDILSPVLAKGLPLPGERLFLPDFIKFQYGDLRESCHPHRTVIQELREVGIDPISWKVSGTLIGTLTTRVQDKEEEKDKEKEEEKDKDRVRTKNGMLVQCAAWDAVGDKVPA